MFNISINIHEYILPYKDIKVRYKVLWERDVYSVERERDLHERDRKRQTEREKERERE